MFGLINLYKNSNQIVPKLLKSSHFLPLFEMTPTSETAFEVKLSDHLFKEEFLKEIAVRCIFFPFLPFLCFFTNRNK